MSAEKKLDGEVDARAFNPRAKIIERLLDKDVPLQAQHAPKRGSQRGLCGSLGQIKPWGIGVTCPECLRLLEKRKARRR